VRRGGVPHRDTLAPEPREALQSHKTCPSQGHLSKRPQREPGEKHHTQVSLAWIPLGSGANGAQGWCVPYRDILAREPREALWSHDTCVPRRGTSAWGTASKIRKLQSHVSLAGTPHGSGPYGVQGGVPYRDTLVREPLGSRVNGAQSWCPLQGHHSSGAWGGP
jgi:hypothetical protein